MYFMQMEIYFLYILLILTYVAIRNFKKIQVIEWNRPLDFSLENFCLRIPMSRIRFLFGSRKYLLSNFSCSHKKKKRFVLNEDLQQSQ